MYVCIYYVCHKYLTTTYFPPSNPTIPNEHIGEESFPEGVCVQSTIPSPLRNIFGVLPNERPYVIVLSQLRMNGAHAQKKKLLAFTSQRVLYGTQWPSWTWLSCGPADFPLSLSVIFSEAPMDECSYSSGPGGILVSDQGIGL